MQHKAYTIYTLIIFCLQQDIHVGVHSMYTRNSLFKDPLNEDTTPFRMPVLAPLYYLYIPLIKLMIPPCEGQFQKSQWCLLWRSSAVSIQEVPKIMVIYTRYIVYCWTNLPVRIVTPSTVCKLQGCHSTCMYFICPKQKSFCYVM